MYPTTQHGEASEFYYLQFADSFIEKGYPSITSNFKARWVHKLWHSMAGGGVSLTRYDATTKIWKQLGRIYLQEAL